MPNITDNEYMELRHFFEDAGVDFDDADGDIERFIFNEAHKINPQRELSAQRKTYQYTDKVVPTVMDLLPDRFMNGAYSYVDKDSSIMQLMARESREGTSVFEFLKKDPNELKITFALICKNTNAVNFDIDGNLLYLNRDALIKNKHLNSLLLALKLYYFRDYRKAALKEIEIVKEFETNHSMDYKKICKDLIDQNMINAEHVDEDVLALLADNNRGYDKADIEKLSNFLHKVYDDALLRETIKERYAMKMNVNYMHKVVLVNELEATDSDAKVEYDNDKKSYSCDIDGEHFEGTDEELIDFCTDIRNHRVGI